MLGRLVAKLLFKACVPLVAVAGVMSYGVYLKGGDPGKLWQHLASGAFDKAVGSFTDAKGEVAGFAGQLSDTAAGSTVLGGNASTTEVFTWKDAQGVTHFGTTAPAGVNAQIQRVDPNVNVLVPVYAPVAVSRPQSTTVDAAEFPAALGYNQKRTLDKLQASQNQTRERSSQSVQQLESELGGPLPGIAGQLLSGGSGKGGSNDSSQLIQLLQSAGH